MDSRERSYYYQQKINSSKNKREWIPRFIRRFFHQHPRRLLIGGIISIGLLMISPEFPNFYKKLTMPKEEYEVYIAEIKRKGLRRATVGEGWIMPFTGTTWNMYTPDEVYIKDLQEIQRQKRMKKDFQKLDKFFGYEPPVEVSDDD